MNLKTLTAPERAIVEWQYGMSGDFARTLMDAIARADTTNLNLLRLGFPNEVEGFERFSRESGWWERVQSKAQTSEAA